LHKQNRAAVTAYPKDTRERPVVLGKTGWCWGLQLELAQAKSA